MLRQSDGLSDEDLAAGGGVLDSAGKDTSVPDGRLDLLEGRVAHEDLERDDDRARGHPLRSLRRGSHGVTTTWVSAGIELTGRCSTATSYFFSRWRIWLATMTLLPIPASQAMTTVRMSRPLTSGMPITLPSEPLTASCERCLGDRLLRAAEAEQQRGDAERHDRGYRDGEQDTEVAADGGHGHVGEDAAR